jgi:hypothetical protein
MNTYYFAVHDSQGFWGDLHIRAESPALALARCQEWINTEDDPRFDSLEPTYTLTPIEDPHQCPR